MTRSGVKQFSWHFVQMVVAMTVGMAVLAAKWPPVFAKLGWPDALQRPEVAVLVVATDMAIGMALWMWWKRHGWASIAEMTLAMYVPFVALFPGLWLGILSGDALMIGGHVLMVPAMLAAMWWRRDEYARPHVGRRLSH